MLYPDYFNYYRGKPRPEVKPVHDVKPHRWVTGEIIHGLILATENH